MVRLLYINIALRHAYCAQEYKLGHATVYGWPAGSR